MAYQVIARKWRPQKFDDVTGQEAITRTLQNAIEQRRLHHAYLLSGARGVGKTTTARLFAKGLNCVKGPTTEPCNECASCTEIAASTSIDVYEIDAASNTGVDNVREVIINSLNIAPARDKYKIFIIDEVHMLSNNAFNALLKTLEEPPAHVIFVMATTELHKVPETILSRCQLFEFKTISSQKIFDRLKLIARAEEVTISDPALNLIVRAGEGSMRDAQSAFDQVISFAGKDIKDEDVRSALGIIGSQALNAFVEAIANSDTKRVLMLVDDLVSRGYDLRNFTRELMTHFRNLLVIRAVGPDRELVAATEVEAAEMKRLADDFSDEDLVRFFNVLTKVEQDIKNSTQERFQLELGLLKLTQMSRLASLEELLERIKRLESGIGGGGQITPTSRSTASTAASRMPSPPARPVKTESQTASAPTRPASSPPSTRSEAPPEPPPIDEAYESVVEIPRTASSGSPVDRIKSLLDQRKKFRALTSIEGADNISIDGNVLRIVFSPKAKTFAEQLGQRDTIKLLEEIAGEVTGKKISLSISGAGTSTPEAKSKANGVTDPESSKKSPRERANEDPIVQSFVKTFRGQIVDVKSPEDND